MKVFYFLSISIALILFISCSVEPKKIDYGKDACYYCKMNIVDKLYAAEIVTKKGKDFKYDAIECMLNYIKDKEQDKIALFLVTDYSTPGKLIDAKTATFLISDTLQSPMGENLAAFEIKEKAIHFVKKNNGSLYTWTEIQQHFFNK